MTHSNLDWKSCLVDFYDAHEKEIKKERSKFFKVDTNVGAYIISINSDGEFLRFRKDKLKNAYIFQVGSRTRDLVPNGLNDQFNYLSPNGAGFEKYCSLLRSWIDFSNNLKLSAVDKYIANKTIEADLGLALNDKTKRAKIFFEIEIPGESNSSTWDDVALLTSWLEFCEKSVPPNEEVFCSVAGVNKPSAKKHGRLLGKGVLISRCGDMNFPQISDEISKKIHLSIEFLYRRQKIIIGNGNVKKQCILIPSIDKNQTKHGTVPDFISRFITDDSENDFETDAKILRNAILGSCQNQTLEQMPEINVLEFTSMDLVPGRIFVSDFYSLKPSLLIQNLKRYNDKYQWNFRNGPRPPNFFDVANFLVNPNAKQSFREKKIAQLKIMMFRGQIFDSTIEKVLAEKSLRDPSRQDLRDVACSVIKGNKGAGMSLDRSIDNRDYLMGRLLAVCYKIEYDSLKIKDQHGKRLTWAEKYMKNFSKNPGDTYRKLNEKILHHKKNLMRSDAVALLAVSEKELQSIMEMMKPEYLTSNNPLSPEFLVAYEHQRNWFYLPKSEKDKIDRTSGVILDNAFGKCL